jgi:hypothetical protein
LFKSRTGLVALPSDDPMSLLLTAIATTEIVGDTITLPGGAQWPDLGSSVLFVRPHSQGLWTGVLAEGLAEELRGAALVGTPGSKSWDGVL